MGRKNSLAFTLVELVIVVGIIGVLVLIAIAYFRGQIFKGSDARRKSDINRIKIAVEEYEKDHNCYPLPQYVTCNPGMGLRPYLDKVPCDPRTGASYFYDYQDSSCPAWYRFFSLLENTHDSQAIPGIGPNSAFNFVQYSANAPLVVGGSQTSPPGGGGGPTAPPGGGGSQIGFYGCKGGVCVPIGWDQARPGPECDPNYQNSNCYGQCGPSQNECLSWH